MRIIIDRFEGDIAVVELGNRMLNVPRELFADAHEGDTAEISVLGKVHREGEEPHVLFEQLREANPDAQKPKKKPSSKRKQSSDSAD